MDFDNTFLNKSNNNDNQFQQSLRNSFNTSQSDVKETSIILPPTIPTEDIRYKQDVIAAAHDIKAKWLMNCKENKPDYTNAASKCLERFIEGMERMHKINPVAVVSVAGLEYYCFKSTWLWLAYMMHQRLWPKKPNPYPDPFQKLSIINYKFWLSNTTLNFL